MKFILIALIVTSCFSAKRDNYDYDEERMLDAVPLEPAAPPKKKRTVSSYDLNIDVNWRQWLCCWDTCGKKNNLHKISKSSNSPYLNCVCKDGRVFELRKKGKIKIRELGEYEAS